jgi:hypothetical protein
MRAALAATLVACCANAAADATLPEAPAQPRTRTRTCNVIPDPDAPSGRSVKCVDTEQPTDPNAILVQRCQEEARPLHGTPQWVQRMKACVERVIGKGTPAPQESTPGPFPPPK